MGDIENYKKYTSNFWDDNVLSTNGFDAIVEHINKTLDILSSMIELLQSRMAIENTYAKALKKSVSSTLKGDKSGKCEAVLRSMALGIAAEGDIRIKFTEEVTKNIVEPLKETFKKQYDVIKKLKGDCLVFIKNRKSQHEHASKSCKNYTMKVRAHEALLKKHQNPNEDEKIKLKLHKNFQTVLLAEKDTKISIEMLRQSIIDWEKKYIVFCQQTEHLDISIINEIHSSLESFSRLSRTVLSECGNIINEVVKLPDDFQVDTYTDKFVTEKGNFNLLAKYVYMIHKGEGDKVEYNFEIVLKQESRKSICYAPLSSSASSATAEKSKSNFYVKKDNNVEGISSPEIIPPDPPVDTNTCEYSVGSTVTALYDYTAQNDDELSFNTGAEITIVSQEDEAWYVGRLNDGKVGVFPISYAQHK